MRRFESRTVQKFSLTLCAVFLLKTVAFARADERTPQTFDIAPQALASALTAFARQSHEEILFAPDVVATKRTAGVKGTMTALVALKVLLKDSGLPFSSTPSGAILIGDPSSNGVQSTSSTSTSANDQPNKEGDKSSSSFLVAQATPGQSSSPSTVEKQDEQVSKKKKSDQLQEVVVTGSRIPTAAGQGPQDVKVYTREKIDQSGQTTIADFLNTVPAVSIATNENNFQTPYGVTTVQLHGLPAGTTLVLINGRRVNSTGVAAASSENVFDLNNIPLAAVERIEVLSQGSSAIYGSDAIGGVVNIILKKTFNGFEANLQYGHAADFSDRTANIAWGHTWDRASLLVVGSLQSRGELAGFDRANTANADYTDQGGADNNVFECSPGNVFSPDGVTPLPGLGSSTYAAVPHGFRGTPTIGEFAETANHLNECSFYAYQSLIPRADRNGVLASGTYQLGDSAEVFAELLYSKSDQEIRSFPASVYGVPGYQQFTVSASNPYNPFGTTVGIASIFQGYDRTLQDLNTRYFRGLAGIKGTLLNEWHWELASWYSGDHTDYSQSNNLDATRTQDALNATNPATALNPFIDGPPGSPQLLQSLLDSNILSTFGGRTVSINGVLHGPIFTLPSGSADLALGSEYNRDTLDYHYINGYVPGPPVSDQRSRYALFAEARVPLIASRSEKPRGETLALTLAGRYDHDSQFGAKTTPQFGIELRPIDTLLLRGTYGQAFKAPSLYQLDQPVVSYQTPVMDPRNGGQSTVVTVLQGGNPNLRPETGRTISFGLVYTSQVIPGFQASVTHWDIQETNSIQSIDAQTLVNNEDLFSTYVIRNNSGQITQIDAVPVNYGQIKVAGLDFQLDYTLETGIGVWRPSLSVTNTYHYSYALAPAAPPIDATSKAQDTGDWAPRWKGAAELGWKKGPFSASVTGRYVSSYRDYDSTRTIGNFWLADGNLRWDLLQTFRTDHKALGGMYLAVGGVNLFNKLPQYSNYYGGFVGYDPAQADIRGRFLYVRFGDKF